MNSVSPFIQSKLNEEQFAAAMYHKTSSLILAGAGSGKTRTLTYKIANLIYGEGTKPDRILAVTFTNKAAHEMRERMMALGKEIAEHQPVSGASGTGFDFDAMIAGFGEDNAKPVVEINEHNTKRIGTFHSIFLKILKEDIDKMDETYTKNFTIYDPAETTSVIKSALKELGFEEHVKPNEVKGFISKQKNQGITASSLKESPTLSNYDLTMAEVYLKYEKALKAANALDFDDLLLIPYLLFMKNAAILTKRQNKWDYIMVDEAQDTNRIQFELMRLLAKGCNNITMIGDDYQSIYGRRGAMMDNFLNVKRFWPDIEIFKLQVNYRSRPHIVTAGSHIIKNNTKQYEKNISAHRTGDDKITVFAQRSDLDEAANIVELLAKIKREKNIARWDIAILYRTNAQSSSFEQVLLQEGIPYKVRGAFKFFERKEVKDIISYLKYILNPLDPVSLGRIINLPSRKIGDTSWAKIEEYATLHNMTQHEVMSQLDLLGLDITRQAQTGISSFVQLIQELKIELIIATPANLIASLVRKISYKDYLIKEEWNDAKAEEKFENIGQLINMADRYENTGEDTLRQFMEEVTLLTDATDSARDDADFVNLLTIHTSKGLEFPMVFIVGLEEGIFPLANAIMDPNQLEEERRLMYVAITRAKDHLFLSHANSRMQRWQTRSNPPSRFIAELPVELIKYYDLAGGANTWLHSAPTINLEEGDLVRHKLFGKGYVLEVWQWLAIVQCENPKFGTRKIEIRFLEKI